MSAFNAVRFKVKPGRESEFLDAHRSIVEQWPGLRRAHIIETGGGGYCIIAEWEDEEAIAGARAAMVATLDSFRDCLEELGDGRGVTDPVSGPAVLSVG